MNFNLEKSLEILERTPRVLRDLLTGLSDEWTSNNEGENTWSPYDVIGHLIHGEKTDWMQRVTIILNEEGDKKFAPFDRFAQFGESKGKTLNDLLNQFEQARKQNLVHLRSLHLTEEHFNITGIHPSFGVVTMRQLLSTWAVHDLDHISQIVRVMAKQYAGPVGPWKEYLRILK